MTERYKGWLKKDGLIITRKRKQILTHYMDYVFNN